MANQTIGVNLKFSADVSAAKRAMSELQSSLAQIHNVAATSANPGIRYAKDLNQASQAAAQLRIQLQNAFNQDTGKLNLTKFNMEMKQAGMSVEKYRAALTSIGPQGQQAFTQLAHAITIADTHTISLSNGLQRLGTTFMNTLRYQLSSSVLMAFTSGIGEAVRYVKDLNTSLNDIRIVTSYGVDEMKEFANQANKAAKALSTTTNEYAKASLIYFQQGLGNDEVQKRTDLTIKMANVTKQSVSEVSDQLTAVWNNFDNGTKSLDHYVDVMVALGAATASSSEEISEGLNKFAAVAETVGLSYEYAASALATVTATTRQSADVVGTAFKTLFARVQDLELGKELDDGTTLGEYSQALMAVGINIKDASGGLKDMNDILDEMGAKWNTLSKDSQVALAQNVAGVRQYTQLIALMDNWDFFKQNLNTANASTGALQEQADIYAESWEAASQRVTASLETIYNKLLNDEFFIDATNMLADFIGLIDNLIDGLGGMPGLLALVGTALTRVFSTQLANGINTMAYNIRSMTKVGKAENAKMQNDFATAAAKEYGTTGMKGQQGVLAKEEASSQLAFIKNKGKMNEMQRQSLELRLKELNAQKQTLNSEIEETKSLERQAQVQKKIAKEMTSQSTANRRDGFGDNTLNAAQQSGNKYLQNATRIQSRSVAGNQRGFFDLGATGREQAIDDLQRSSAALSINDQSLDIGGEDTFKPITGAGIITNGEHQIGAINELQSRLKELGVTAEGVEAQMQDAVGPELSQQYQGLAQAADMAEDKIKRLQQELKEQKITQKEFEQGVRAANVAVSQQAQELQENAAEMSRDSNEALRLSGVTEESRQAFINNGTAVGNNQHRIAQLRQQHRGLQRDIDKSTIKTLDFGSSMAAAANVISTTTMVVTSVVGLFKTLADEEVSAGEKVTTVLTTLGFLLPMVITLFNEQNKALFLTIGRNLAVAGSQAGLTTSMEITSFSALKLNAVMKGLGKTLAKFAIYAAAIAVVVVAVKALADAANNARNSAANFAASANEGAKAMAEAYSKATESFNKLKDSIESYGNALESLHKLTEGTNEYKQALFDANEQALALIQSHAGLKYYIDSNGLIVFAEGELDRIEEESQQKKVAAYTSKLQADRTAREANIENQKVQLGRKTRGQDFEWNDEDTGKLAGGTAIGTGVGAASMGIAAAAMGGAAFGGKLGLALGSVAPGIGNAIGIAAGIILGGAVGAISGAIGGLEASALDNDATDEEKKAMDAIYEAYKEQGEAALSETGIRNALKPIGITNEKLIKSLAENDDSLRDLMQSMDANTAATWAETQIAAREQAHALDPTLQYKDSLAQQAITESLVKIRQDTQEKSTTTEKDYYKTGFLGMWQSTKEGREQVKKWAQDQNLENFKVKNYTNKGYLTYEYYDKEQGKMATKDLQYSVLKAWEQGKEIDEAAKTAYQGISNSINKIQELKNGEGLLSIVGGQDLISLSENELNAFKESFTKGEFNNFIENNWKTLGYESADAFSKAIAEGIVNWDYETAFGQFSSQLNAEIKGVLQAGAEETEYTAGALENYTEALAENTEGLHDNGDAWKNLEKKKLAAQAAVANVKTIKGIDALTEVLEDNIETLKKWDEASLDTWEAADKVQTALEDVFGLRVSANYVKEWLPEIGELAEGNTEKLQEMSKAAAVDFALNLDTTTEENRNWFASLLEDFADQAEAANFEIGMTINDSAYIEKLNAMLDAGEITAEQVQQAFGALGYVPDIKYETKEQEVRTESYVFAEGTTDTSDLSKAKPIVTITKNKIQVPYIAGKGSHRKPETATTAADGTTTTSVSGRENGTGLTLMRDVGSIDASIGADAKTVKSNKQSIDRYKEINEQLSDIERHLNKISKAKDRVFGNAKVQLIQQEIDKQNELIAAEETYLREIEEWYKKDWENLDSQFELDEKGRISNYTEVLEANIGSNNFDKLKEQADQYIETLNLLEEQQEKVNDKKLKMQDMEFEKITVEVEYKIEINDRAIKRLEYTLERLNDPIWDAADAIGVLGRIADENFKNIDIYSIGIDKTLEKLGMAPERLEAFKNADIDNLSSFLGDIDWNNADAVEDLKGYLDSLYGIQEWLDGFPEEVMNEVNEAFDDMNEKAERAANRVEFLGGILENYQNIIDLVGKNALGVTDDQIRALSKARVEQAKTNLEIKQGQLDLAESALSSAKKSLEEAQKSGNEELIQQWQEQVNTMEDKVWELQGEVESGWADTLQVIADDFQNAIDTAIGAFEKAMSGSYGSFDKMQQAFDQQQKIGDRYVSNYQKIYELSKLNRNITQSIDDTDSIRGKQELVELQKEINALQESDTELSQYDVEYLQKKYDLRLAEIALEEAQNAKSQVRMRRDNEGNWSYVYTADEDKTTDAAQNYEDKLYEMQKHSQDYIDEMESQLIQNYMDMTEELAGIREEDFNSYEEFEAEKNRILEYYRSNHNYILDEMNKALVNSNTTYNEDWLNYENYNGKKLIADFNWRTQFSETFTAQTNGYTTVKDALVAFDAETAPLMDAIGQGYTDWKSAAEDAFRIVGEKFEGFGGENGTLKDYVKNITNKLGDIDTAFGKWKGSAETGFQDIIDKANEKFTAFNTGMEKYKGVLDTLTAKLEAFFALAATEVDPKPVEDTTNEVVQTDTTGGEVVQTNTEGDGENTTGGEVVQTNTEGDGENTTGGDLTDPQKNNRFKVGDIVSPTRYIYGGQTTSQKVNFYYKRGGKFESPTAFELFTNPKPQESRLHKATVNDVSSDGKYIQVLSTTKNHKTYMYWVLASEFMDASRYDTGGYTGSWDSSGRLAMLHQKEIVLNAHDTENFLAAVNIVRDIASAIDLRAAAYEHQLSSMAYAYSAGGAPQMLQQDVTIHAEFPNVRERSEIEAAFDNLINRASQFANRKNK